MLRAIVFTLALSISVGNVAASASTTEMNRLVVDRFVSLLYEHHDVRKAFECCVSANYTQHSPGIADGRHAAIRVLTPMFARPGFHTSYRRPMVDGDMAVVMMHAGMAGSRGGAIVDIYRLKDERIVEHWDVNESIPSVASNSHPFF